MTRPHNRTHPRLAGPPVRLLHQLPNRLRLEVPALREGGDGLVEALKTAVGAVDGVGRVNGNRLTGSLLVEHDGAPGRERAILAALYGVVPPAPAEPARLLEDLRRLGRTLDRATLRASGGWIDVQTALPLLLGIYGVTRLLRERTLGTPATVTLLWWAYGGLRHIGRGDAPFEREKED